MPSNGGVVMNLRLEVPSRKSFLGTDDEEDCEKTQSTQSLHLSQIRTVHIPSTN
jgi:hypothetical protein